MSKQQQAPGELEHVRAFINTLDIEAAEEQLGSPGELAAWLAGQGLAAPSTAVTPADLRRTLELREALRAILLANNGGPPVADGEAAVLDAAACRAEIRLRFRPGAAGSLEAEAGGVDGALGRLLTIVHGAVASETWGRLKACRLHTCEWAFYDHTKNRSGAWCNMDVCGNRAKARAYRERRSASHHG